jgi:hypothetical protein
MLLIIINKINRASWIIIRTYIICYNLRSSVCICGFILPYSFTPRTPRLRVNPSLCFFLSFLRVLCASVVILIFSWEKIYF